MIPKGLKQFCFGLVKIQGVFWFKKKYQSCHGFPNKQLHSHLHVTAHNGLQTHILRVLLVASVLMADNFDL